jgi:hypothetical protein
VSPCVLTVGGAGGRTECHRPIASHLGESRPRRGRPPGGRHRDSNCCGKRSTRPGRLPGRRCAVRGAPPGSC